MSPSGSGGEVDQTQTLTQLILELPLHVDSEGELIKKYDKIRGVTDDEEEPETSQRVDSDSEEEEHQTEEDPDTIIYEPGSAIRYVWLGVTRFFEKSGGNISHPHPICLDTADVREAAFYCILTHLRTAAKNHEATLTSNKDVQNMIEQARGDGTGLVGQTTYWRIRSPPFDFVQHFGNSNNHSHWLQVNASAPKQATRRLLRFLTEVNCYARLKTKEKLPWGAEDHGAQGSHARVYNEKWPLFADCLAALYQTRYVRLLTADVVGENTEADVYCVPMELYTFRQVEWPVSLYFPISRSCPGIMPPKVLEAVTIFQSHVVEKAMLADGTVDVDSVSRTRKGRQELGVLLGGFDNAFSRQKDKRKNRKKNKSGAASSARALAPDDDRESDQ